MKALLFTYNGGTSSIFHELIGESIASPICLPVTGLTLLLLLSTYNSGTFSTFHELTGVSIASPVYIPADGLLSNATHLISAIKPSSDTAESTETL